mmetsp:Transcript_6064/g.14499  ORF Transcript_6064/g.14499 Transcript_6064/m.14499 type:complete len:203 (-) Transcript_6064:49-657(-)
MGNSCCCNDKATPDLKVVHVAPQRSQPTAELFSEDVPASVREGMGSEKETVGDGLLQDAGLPLIAEGLEKPEAEPAAVPSTAPEPIQSNGSGENATEEPGKPHKRTTAPPDISETFEVVIVKPTGCRLGMDLSHRGTHLVVRKIYPDHVVVKHNEAARAAGTPELREADIVVAINGVKGVDKEMLAVCKDSPTLKFNVFRPV